MSAHQYRENPRRAVHVLGQISFDLVSRLTPAVTALRCEPGIPITVYIDSLGGDTSAMDALLSLLRAPDADGKVFPLTTVVTSRAASAAADLLVSGDYAIAFPDSLVHYHGTRSSANAVTMEAAHEIAGNLRVANEQFALRLARRIISRLLFLLMVHRHEIEREPGTVDLTSPAAVFVALLQRKLGALHADYAKLIQEARTAQQETSALVDAVLANAGPPPAEETEPSLVAGQIRIAHALLDYELARRDRPPGWSLLNGGLDELTRHFLQLADFVAGEHNQHRQRLVDDYGLVMLTQEENSKLVTLPETDRASWLIQRAEPRMGEFWYFVVCLSRRLQTGENGLSAEAAYWLGLVDEVPGSGLPCMRHILESNTPASPPTSPA
jgi:ATP-dependent protease ClpP protease subunit